MLKLVLIVALAFLPSIFPATAARAANRPTSVAVAPSSMQLVARRYTARRNTSSAPTPHYLLLKSDPRRYNGPNYFVHPPYLR
ncbi:MAG: hypothetical protein C0483_02345 [Pirellula sp.]|nr:hypothetical protein [Pirellula sp.]